MQIQKTQIVQASSSVLKVVRNFQIFYKKTLSTISFFKCLSISMEKVLAVETVVLDVETILFLENI